MQRKSVNEDDGPLREFIREPSGFEHKRLEAGRQASLFDQPGSSSFSRGRMHDAINLDEARFGQALGDYSNLCPPPAPADPPFDFHSETGPGPGPRDNIDPFLSMRAGHGAGDLSSVSDPGGLAPTTSAGPSTALTGATSPGLLSMSDFSSRPINLKAYEVIASNFKELSLEFGGSSSSARSNNISESQRTAQHELFVKLYYEHFKQQAY
ncbi:hypothetical protein GL218_05794 [Daldinia childiae]|uniref:uncharacterized protein n=1 Tax=Daldinia childiae TaxID=326645 RepID=UPI0014456982|nr:uncharacterized protein GL218_05794 [Daldinia childiae]KAF3058015.1 hypothetical protein GL218_05794 [Daldinia childiae]